MIIRPLLSTFKFTRWLHVKCMLTKERYYTDSDVFLADSVDFADSSDFRADSWTFFHDGWAALKIACGHTAGPEGRSGGRSEARSAERRPERSPEGPAVCPDVIFNLAQISWKKVQLLSKEVQATQQNSRYSAKNNVAIHMIATFMSKYFWTLTSLFLSYQYFNWLYSNI